MEHCPVKLLSKMSSHLCPSTPVQLSDRTKTFVLSLWNKRMTVGIGPFPERRDPHFPT